MESIGKIFGILFSIAFWGGIIWLIVRASKKKKEAKLEQQKLAFEMQQKADRQRQEAEQKKVEESEARELHRLEREAEMKRQHEARVHRLTEKYGSVTAKRIMGRVPELGDTEEIIVEMFGRPADTDIKQTTKKTTITYKYAQKTKTQFGLIFKFDDGLLAEWEDKQ